MIKKTPAKRDIVKEYTQAVREAGMKVGIYFSLIDWSDPRYRTVYPEGSDPQNHHIILIGDGAVVKRPRLRYISHGINTIVDKYT